MTTPGDMTGWDPLSPGPGQPVLRPRFDAQAGAVVWLPDGHAEGTTDDLLFRGPLARHRQWAAGVLGFADVPPEPPPVSPTAAPSEPRGPLIPAGPRGAPDHTDWLGTRIRHR
jgi:hypothetical protein